MNNWDLWRYREAQRRLAYSIETRRQALALYGLIFPPWRWPQWWRTRREVRERLETLKRCRAEVDITSRTPPPA